jgi:hypothetical protein
MTVVPDWFFLGRCVVRIRKVAGVLIGIAALFVMAAPAAAQDKMLANAGVGYLYFHGATSCGDGCTTGNPKTKASQGIALSAAGRIHDKISGLMEFSMVTNGQHGSYLNGDADPTGPNPARAQGSLKIFDLGTGLRVGSGSGKKFEYFGQFVIAWQRRSGKFINIPPTPPATQATPIVDTNPATNTGSVANDGLNLQPGGGLDFWFNHKMGVRFQGDFERIKADTTLLKFYQNNSVPSRWTNNYRFVVSVVFQGVKK